MRVRAWLKQNEILAVVVFLASAACAPAEPAEPAPECTSHGACDGFEKPYCEPETQKCAPMPAGYPLGWGDGSPETVAFEEVFKSAEGRVIRGLDFRPNSEELWVTEGQRVQGAMACNKNSGTAEICEPLGADFVIVYRATTTADRWVRLRDPNAFHFARNASALVFSENDFFGTCVESRTSNYDDEPDDYTGPVLWSADRSILAINIGKNGTHMDMLHFTPFCMGLEHEKDNVYWAFNGHVGSIDRYDFVEDHGPGEDDHSDGEVLRYIKGEVRRVPDVSSQMAFDREQGYLYIADTGNERILALDTQSGRRGGVVDGPNYDYIRVRHRMLDAEFDELDLEGSRLGMPSGLLLHEGLLYIADHTHSEFRVHTTDGALIRTLYTDFPGDSIGSMVMGPDDRIYFAVPNEGKVYRIEYDLRD